eukprot:TRINITY_DN33754_c0_g1_i1.p1 TRINITY_DN33754_c0_g1~~TRINITY_DN33754_c0_g1_i1.p1  ORF type:complete len:482 (+),score=49.40 TRINITY_DN33754_c0_g1_i1:81-1526(+)
MAVATQTAALRALLRVSREADRHPAGLVGLLGHPTRVYDHNSRRTLRTERNDRLAFVDDAIREAAGGSTEYSHPCPDAANATAAVRRHYRRARDIGMLSSYAAEARLLRDRFNASVSLAKRLDAGSKSLAESDLCQSGGATGSGQKPFQRLPPGCQVDAAAGDILLAHPLADMQSIFDRCVLLLNDASDEDGRVTGVVVNKPTFATFAQMLERWKPQPQEDEWLDTKALGPLMEQKLYRGGPIIATGSLRESLRWLHVYGEGLPGAQKVAPGLWMGGDLAEVARRFQADRAISGGGDRESDDAAAAPEKDRKDRAEAEGEGEVDKTAASQSPRLQEDTVRLFIGYSAWAPRQLQTELQNGIWARARRVDPREASPLRALALSEKERMDAWSGALNDIGMYALATFPRGEAVDRRLRRYVASCRERGFEEISDDYLDEVEQRPSSDAEEVSWGRSSAAIRQPVAVQRSGRAVGARVRRSQSS